MLKRAAPVFALVSGVSALVYEVLWLRQLGLLFGNTAHAAATGFSIFFAGLALGGWIFGRRAATLRRPLATYAWIELAIAASGSLYFWLPDAYRRLHAPLFDLAGDSEALFLAAKASLAALALLPPAFFMGATMPVLGQAAIGRSETFGREGALLYAFNTAGAGAGALAAGFVLPPVFGFRGACLVAMGINVLVALGALLVAARPSARPIPPHPQEPPRDIGGIPWQLCAVAATSGWAVLGVEVAASLLFAQVFQNSVYTFAIVLVVFLLTLAAGSLLASRLATRTARPWPVLGVAGLVTGLTIGAVPFVFFRVTAGLQYVAAGEGWATYVATAFGLTLLVLALPCTAAGVIFPFLLRLAEGPNARIGHAFGTLSAWNTIGAIAGAAVTGFVLLPAVGLWRTFIVFAAAYLTMAVLILSRHSRGWLPAAPAFAAIAVFTVLRPTDLPRLRLNEAAGERVLEVWESHYGVTAVVERPGERLIKLNNNYALGGSGSVEQERNQALLPLMTHPDPRSIFFLGMGTGITAGAGVQPGVERIVVAELVPDVVRAANRHFREFANGLFDDPRVHIVVNDGRSQLAAVRESYDLILGDLFVPWEAGAGSLYTREHFTVARDRLTPHGIFVQWLPLYQMSKPEFMTIARTMLAVFPEVVLWRNDFSSSWPVVALAGANRLSPMDLESITRRAQTIDGPDVSPDVARALTLPYYAGHLSMVTGVVPGGPLNVDDRPVIEYAAPLSQRRQRAGEISWFTAGDLIAFFGQVLDAVPPESDPYLARLTDADRSWVRSGFHHHSAAVYRALGDETRAADAVREAFRLTSQGD
jgi:spermidine synthase